MKTPISLPVAVAICVSIIMTVAPANAATVWPAYEHDSSHSGRSQFSTAGNNGATKWDLPTGGFKIEDSPTVGADGTIYDADTAGDFYAITPSGAAKWSAPFQAIQGSGCGGIPGINAGAAIGPHGAIYFADQDAQVYSLTDNGIGTSPTLNWGPVQPTGDCAHFVTTGAPTLSIDGSTLYILISDGKLYALSTSTGVEKWSAVIGTGGSTGTIAPVVGPDGAIYAASSDGKLASIKDNGVSASFNWGPATFATSFSGDSPSLSNDGSTLYIAGNTTSPVAGNLFAIKAGTGAAKWTALTLGSGEVFNTGVALGSDGATIYLGSGKSTSHTLYAVTDGGTSGALKWSLSVGGSSLKVSAAISADGTIYVSSGDGNLYAVTDTGVSGSLRPFFGGTGSVLVNFTAAAGYKALSMPAIGSDGTIYMSSDTDDNFYAYNGLVTATATASPTPTASKTATATATTVRTATPTATATDTATVTATTTTTPAATPSSTPSSTSSATPTLTPTPSVTATAARTGSPSPTATVSPTVTVTASATPTSIRTPLMSVTATPTPTSTATPSATATFTPTPMPTVAAPLVVTPGSVNFTAKLGKKSKAKKITAANKGSVAITLVGAQVTGDFQLSKLCAGPLQPKKKCTYAVTFAPTQTGSRSGLLTINNNSSSGPRTVSLSGTGK